MSRKNSIQEELDYLNEQVLNRLWNAGKGLIGDNAINLITNELIKLPDFVLPVSGSDKNFNNLPSIVQSNGKILLQVPGNNGNLNLKFFLNKGLVAAADFNFTLELHSNKEPTRSFKINTNLEIPGGFYILCAILGVVSFGPFGVSAALIPQLIKEIIEEVLNGIFGRPGGDVDQGLAMLSKITYDHNSPYPYRALECFGPIDNNLGTNLAQGPIDGIDIVFVADNFSYDGSRSDFVSKTDRIVSVFFDENRIDNARFRAIKSIIRFWRLPIFGKHSSELIVTDTVSGSRKVSSIGNLSRLAETGLRIKSALAANPDHSAQTRPILVILKRMSDPSLPAAIALGDVVLLPINDSEYLFSWDDIPGNDEQRLINFLNQSYSIGWVNSAKITKINNGITINVSAGQNYLSLSLNNNKTKVNLQIDDGRTDEFVVNIENSMLRIYDSKGKIAGSTLIHELGHVIGGLADEYIIKNEKYMGPEPSAINVSKFLPIPIPIFGGWIHPKWKDWIGKLPDASKNVEYKVSGQNLGAYEFADGIYSPAQRCKMRNSDADNAFCPVCEATLAMELCKRVGFSSPNLRPPLTLEIQYRFPWVSDPKRYTVLAPINGGEASSQIMLPAANMYEGRNENTTGIMFKVVRSAIPDYFSEVQILPGSAISTEYITVKKDSIVKIKVKPDSSSPIPAVYKSLCQTVTLVFNQEPKLSEPTSLFQSPGVGAVIHRVVDHYGMLSLNLILGASSGGRMDDFVQPTKMVFVVQNENGTIKEYSDRNITGLHKVSPKCLPIGKFRWYAVSRIDETDIESKHATLNNNGILFEVRDVVVDPYNELPPPLDAYIKFHILKFLSPNLHNHPNLPPDWEMPNIPKPVELPPNWEIPTIPDVHPRPVPGIGGMPDIDPNYSTPLQDRLSMFEKYIRNEDMMHSTLKKFSIMHSNMPSTMDKLLPDKTIIRNTANLTLPPGAPKEEEMPLLEIFNRMNRIKTSKGIRNSSVILKSNKNYYTEYSFFAKAYHPEGRPIAFEFEVFWRNEKFTGSYMIYSEYKMPTNPDCSYLVEANVKQPSSYLFSWDDVKSMYIFSGDDFKGNDNESFIEFLKNRYGICLVFPDEIGISDDRKVIWVSFAEHNINLRLNEDGTLVFVEIDDGRTDELITKIEDGKINIYSSDQLIKIRARTMDANGRKSPWLEGVEVHPSFPEKTSSF